jgi:hypothetical protein
MSDPTYAELEIGEEGDHIIELQDRLRESGLDVPASGVFDEETQAVLVVFAESRGVTDGTTASAVAQLATETGELVSAGWTAHYTAPVQARYEGEDQLGNAVWANERRKQTYYPENAEAAKAEFGYELSGGRFVSGGEDGSAQEPLDTTGIVKGATWVGSKPERMIYTMDTKGDFRMADSIAEAQREDREGLRVHHSTTAAGQEVAGAGEMKIREGVVEQVSDASGHYRPDFAMTQQVAGALKNQGVDTDKVTFELGNYLPGDKRLKDTLASGTEVLAYDRDAILADLNPLLRKQVEVAGRQKWSGAWDWLSPEVRTREEDELFAQLAAPYAEMSDRDLQNEARKIMQGRHDRLDAVLAQVKLAKGWREDPLERHQWRWYDGQSWTARVSDSDIQSEDNEGAQLLSPGVAAPSQALSAAGSSADAVPVSGEYASEKGAVDAASSASGMSAQYASERSASDASPSGAGASSQYVAEQTEVVTNQASAGVSSQYVSEQEVVTEQVAAGASAQYVASPAPVSRSSPAPG